MSKGKGKGSQFERDICRLISLWWSKGTNSNIFWRTSNSGGRMTVLSKKGNSGKFHYGDICAIDPIGQPLIDFASIELKRGYPGVTVADLLDKPKGASVTQFEKWIDQAQKAAENSGSFGWLLIHKRDRKDTLVFMPGYVFEQFEWSGESFFMYGALFGMKLDVFLTQDPHIFRAIVAEIKVNWNKE